jgi:cbb3-type cytochrome oxidase subunit 3
MEGSLLSELWTWLSDAHTDLQKGSQIALILFFGVFVGIIIYAFTGKQRQKRFDSYRYLPLDDDQDAGSASTQNQSKGSADDGRE